MGGVPAESNIMKYRLSNLDSVLIIEVTTLVRGGWSLYTEQVSLYRTGPSIQNRSLYTCVLASSSSMSGW